MSDEKSIVNVFYLFTFLPFYLFYFTLLLLPQSTDMLSVD